MGVFDIFSRKDTPSSWEFAINELEYIKNATKK